MNLSELSSEPFAFTQTELLTPEKFRGDLEKRHARFGGIWPRISHLELLHRRGILTPWFEVASDGSLRDALTLEPRTWKRQRDDTHWSYGNEWRYSSYQLLRILELSDVAHRFQLITSNAGGDPGRERWRLRPEGRARLLRRELGEGVLIAVAALETHYRRWVVGRLLLPSGTYEKYEAFDRGFDPAHVARRLELSPEDIRQAAEHLLQRAHEVDPLGDWHQVIDQGSARWDELEGEALIALDHRAAAEMLLFLYEDLAKVGLAEALPTRGSAYDPVKYRVWRGNPSLEKVLTEFGLSTRPLAVVIVPGETEEFFLPKVAEKLGFPLRPYLVDLRSAKGETKRLNSYIAKTVAYRIGEEVQPGLRLAETRPTRVFVVMDPERLYATAEKRRAVKSAWVSDVEKEMLPAGYQVSRRHLRQQIRLGVWHKRLPFEFAHFSDPELGAALIRLYPAKYMEEELIKALRAERRSKQPTIDRAAKRSVDKHRLAQFLWPALEARLDKAITGGVEPNIPIAKFVIEAYRFALNASIYRYFSVPMRKRPR